MQGTPKRGVQTVHVREFIYFGIEAPLAAKITDDLQQSGLNCWQGNRQMRSWLVAYTDNIGGKVEFTYMALNLRTQKPGQFHDCGQSLLLVIGHTGGGKSTFKR